MARPALNFALLIASAFCLMATKAEEQPTVGEAENRQAKQLYLVPQYYPANTQFYYPDSTQYRNPYASPYAGPAAEPFVDASQDVGYVYGYPSLAFGDEGDADWRHVASGGHDGHRAKWWKKYSHRQATINIFPTAAECLIANIEDDGLGPCKEASQAEQGVIEIRFTEAAQTAIVGITADSQRHTRVKLICTELTDGMGVYTQTGQISAVEDTPRTEIGYMQLVVTSAAVDDTLRCNWVSYHHYTAMYP
ncbi:Uncharacterized protein APZ42_017559 [Daphnia magna]|uniref:Uncharacterized protein n=1 Tax=Daphnia magna TaxID=35525 RepID=A0A162CKI0_9CRUS|nr:Uncharacterized protein APZ42_017559 [Daphnia magna]